MPPKSQCPHRPDFQKIEVEMFPDVFNNTPSRRVPLKEFLAMVKRPNPVIEALRKEKNKEQRNALKRKLPCVCLQTTFRPGTDRHKDNIEAFTGLTCIDCDAADNPRLSGEQMKAILSRCPNVLYCALSASGNGAFAIVRLLFADGPAIYAAQFRALQRRCRETLGLNIDPAYKNPAQLRSLSHDPNPHIYLDAEPFALCDPPERPCIQRTAPSVTMTAADTLTDVESCVSEIERQGIDIAPEREQWVEVGFALHTIGDAGKAFFRRVSNLWSRGTTTDAALNAFWSSALKDDNEGAITIGTFFEICRANGITPPRNRVPPEVDFAEDIAEETAKG